MPIRLNVGLTKKIGQPDYGSLGASCHVEIELDHSLLEHDLIGFHDRVRKAFANCREAVNDELTRHHGAQHPSAGQNGHRTIPARNGHTNATNGTAPVAASSSQISYAEQLAKQITGLGVRRLETLCAKAYNKPLVGLTSLEASGLIDLLKEIKTGRIALADALQGAAA